ncbi:hypothetical protein BB560_000993 [Smittium megazygosporum]|uniref:Uncharacterized protein n=1 Tax=Smittium megazygosporum TaxID=133381 RepID=A0A2T9ZIV2_9FUNG|nr:hypothetical protein BB560_000993 [Smittium megazygosporum]
MKKILKPSSIKLCVFVFFLWFVVFRLRSRINSKITALELAYKRCGNDLDCLPKYLEYSDVLAALIAEKNEKLVPPPLPNSPEAQKNKNDNSALSRILASQDPSLDKNNVYQNQENALLNSNSIFLEFQKERVNLAQKASGELEISLGTLKDSKHKYQRAISNDFENGLPDNTYLLRNAEIEMLESYDTEAFSSSFTRLYDWPTQFPENLTHYRESILASKNFTSENERLKHEVAPWTWFHAGSMGSNSTRFYYSRENAAIVSLVRNIELKDLLNSMRQFEDRFNNRFHYPYVFLNDVPFTKKFMIMTSQATESDITFSLVPRSHWEIPKFINRNMAKIYQTNMKSYGVPYADSVSYRQMCRFQSGFFYKHPLLMNRRYYWRIEPDVDFYCDIPYDLFKEMSSQNKKYAFVVFLKELKKTIPTLWANTLTYARKHNITSPLLKLFSTNNRKYNLCHFWSNFEIASLEWMRSDQYESYFRHLDMTGNFFYERWGDAPVHSLAVGLFLKKSEVLFVDDMGYRHDIFTRWPNLNLTSPLAAKYTDVPFPPNKVRCVIPDRLVDSKALQAYKEKHISKTKSDGGYVIDDEELERNLPDNVYYKPKNFDFDNGSCLNLWKQFPDDSKVWAPIDTSIGLMNYNLNNFDFTKQS